MICPRCGYANAPSDETCARCGNTLLPGGSFAQERRWVSVVFFDLSRFTEYALAHPLEDTWQAANNALQSAANHVRLFGGHIDKFFGDGFLAVFGATRSQEFDAKAALEAARAMVNSSPLPARAGVTSGLVLRTPLGGGLAGDQTVLGPAVNLSQRLSGVAPPGEVWTDLTTLRLVPAAIGAPLPPQPLKGYAEPLVPYRYEGIQESSGSIEGRESELELLRSLVGVQTGNGRRVVVYGPMGVGKSHLVQHFIATLPEGIRGTFAPRLTTGVALRHALRQGLQQLLSDGLSRLRSLELPEPFKGILNYSIGIEEKPDLPGEELDRLLIQTWWHLLEQVALDMPLVIALDDMHNADLTVLEFTRQTPPAGVLVVLISRQNRWAAAPDITLLPLKPLSLESAQALIRSFRPDLGPATLLHLAEASGGFPLAVQALSLTPGGEPEPIPLYQPRLDSLPRLARLALQAAAVLGPTVPPELVRHLVGDEADLTRLVGEGFLEADEYGQLCFSIPYLREATLGQVGGPQVQQWHLQAARWYQRQEKLADSATHLEAAGDVAMAYRMWRVVAQQAWNEQDYSKAVGAYLEALRLAEDGVRPQSALEAAEADLALGRYQDALELAELALENSKAPGSLREHGQAIRYEALLLLGQPEAAPPAEVQVPRLRLAIARRARPEEALELLQLMPPDLEASAKLVRSRALLGLGHLDLALQEISSWLESPSNSPTEEFEARLLKSEILWRQHKPLDALDELAGDPHAVLPRWFRARYQAALAALLLDMGDLRRVELLLADAMALLDEAPPATVELVGSVRLRYLIESGQLDQALRFGQEVVARTPNPGLLAMLALVYSLLPGKANAQTLWRLVHGLEAVTDPEVQAICHLAVGLRSTYTQQNVIDPLRKAAFLARKSHNPTLRYYALTMLGLAWEHKAPKKALALSQYLLSQTAGRGFEVQHEFARLLRSQLLLGHGREPLTLLEFTPSTLLARLWQSHLRSVISGEPRTSSRALSHSGILGVWVRWLSRKPRTPVSEDRA